MQCAALSSLFPVPVFVEVIEIIQGVVHGDVAGDMVAHGEEEAGAFFCNGQSGVDFSADGFGCAEGEGAAVHFAADNDVGFPVVFDDVVQRGGGFKNEAVCTCGGDVFHEFGPGSV